MLLLLLLLLWGGVNGARGCSRTIIKNSWVPPTTLWPKGASSKSLPPRTPGLMNKSQGEALKASDGGSETPPAAEALAGG